MKEIFDLPPLAYRLLILQKTQYLKFATSTQVDDLKKVHGDNFDDYYHPLVDFIAQNYQDRILRAFSRDVRADYNSFGKYLDGTVSKLLDIGCGVAGIDLMLHNKFPESSLFLLDKTKEEDKTYYGFKSAGAFYNSLSVTSDFLQRNGVPLYLINLIDANLEDPGKGFPGSLDLVVSLMSWGFHYPVATYLDPVVNNLCRDGMLIIDVRNGTNGISDLKKHFMRLEVVGEFGKASRCVCTGLK